MSFLTVGRVARKGSRVVNVVGVVNCANEVASPNEVVADGSPNMISKSKPWNWLPGTARGRCWRGRRCASEIEVWSWPSVNPWVWWRPMNACEVWRGELGKPCEGWREAPGNPCEFWRGAPVNPWEVWSVDPDNPCEGGRMAPVNPCDGWSVDPNDPCEGGRMAPVNPCDGWSGAPVNPWDGLKEGALLKLLKPGLFRLSGELVPSRPTSPQIIVLLINW